MKEPALTQAPPGLPKSNVNDSTNPSLPVSEFLLLCLAEMSDVCVHMCVKVVEILGSAINMTF